MKLITTLLLASVLISASAFAAEKKVDRAPAAWSSTGKICGRIQSLGGDDASSNMIVKILAKDGTETLAIHGREAPIIGLLSSIFERGSTFCFYYTEPESARGETLKNFSYVARD